MISSTPIEIWVTVQIAIDLCLIILFIIFVRQVRSSPAKSIGVEELTNTVEPVLKEAKQVAMQFDTQLREKQHIVKKLNERLDSRIISLNLLLNRAEMGVTSGENTSSNSATNHMDVYDLQQDIIELAKKDLDPQHIANRLSISKSEVGLVLDLKKKFQEMERT